MTPLLRFVRAHWLELLFAAICGAYLLALGMLLRVAL